jgi:hypothetical protein
MKRLAVELLLLGAALALYAALGNRDEIKRYVALPAGAAAVCYVAGSLSRGRWTLAELGLRTDNLPAAGRAALRVYAPVAAGILLWFAASPVPAPAAGFYLTLMLYPFWGVIQQFLFQSLLHARLMRLGLAPWSVAVTAAVFAAVHVRNPELAALAFPFGLLSSWLFMRHPNIIPIGVAHGVLGAMVYYLLLEKDPMGRMMIGFLNG